MSIHLASGLAAAQLPAHGLLEGLGFTGWTLAAVVLGLAAAFVGLPLLACCALILVAMWLAGAPLLAFVPVVALLAVVALPPLRRVVVSNRLMAIVRRAGLLPTI